MGVKIGGRVKKKEKKRKKKKTTVDIAFWGKVDFGVKSHTLMTLGHTLMTFGTGYGCKVADLCTGLILEEVGKKWILGSKATKGGLGT